MQARTQALRSMHSQKRYPALELCSLPEEEIIDKGDSADFEMPDHVDVEVRIERTVRIERRASLFHLEDYSLAGRSMTYGYPRL
ncbi:hypothetical protein BD626DRAFT_473482 [Schizophyllum amplum]|uniref:Uncharacterized protein n=1 Tax=Schizophyllum amplum TaxID=97359 RepID=A0A550CWW7_9AGAR|nr:hypothetical protein BD626DRAFT_473482 [Auriculariopsis ampla]